MKKTKWAAFGFLAVAIGLYPLIYFLIDRRFGLLSTKSMALLENTVWNLGFYTHILCGGIAMLSGWTQFSASLRRRRLGLHRRLGKVYVVSAWASGVAGLYISFFATGGGVSTAGFMSLALIWLGTTGLAYHHVRHGRIQAHERMMLYSYAACFAAATLRIWLPLLVWALQDFVLAYQIVAWLCWVPNLLVVRFFMAPKRVLSGP